MIVTVVLPQRAPFSSAQLLVQFPRLRKNVSTAQSAVAHPIYECYSKQYTNRSMFGLAKSTRILYCCNKTFKALAHCFGSTVHHWGERVGSKWGVWSAQEKAAGLTPLPSPPPLTHRNNDSEATHFNHSLSFKNMTILSLYLVSGFL